MRFFPIYNEPFADFRSRTNHRRNIILHFFRFFYAFFPAAASRKMEVCFDLFDLNSDGFISGADLVEMLNTVVRFNQHHKEVNESISDIASGDVKTESHEDPGYSKLHSKSERRSTLAISVDETFDDYELVNLIRSQLAGLGKTMTDNNISFKDFCTIVNSHPKILNAMKANTAESNNSIGNSGYEDTQKNPPRRRASTATF